MLTHDISFIQKNFTYRSYNINEFNIVCLLDTNDRIFIDEGYCTVSRKKLVPVIFTDSKLLKESGFIEFLRNDRPGIKKYGILTTDYGLMMIRIRPILTTEDKGPSRGYLIMGKNLDPVRIKTLIKQTELDFSIIKIGNKYTDNDASLINEIINKNESSVIIQDDNMTGVSSLVPDKNTSYNYLIELADSALYQSKNNGRNRVNSAEVKENGEVIFTEYPN